MQQSLITFLLFSGHTSSSGSFNVIRPRLHCNRGLSECISQPQAMCSAGETNGRQITRSKRNRKCRSSVLGYGRVWLRCGLSYAAFETGQKTWRSGMNYISNICFLFLKESWSDGNLPFQVEEARAYSNLGSSYHYRRNFSQAIAYHENVLRIAQNLGDRAIEARAYAGLGHAAR